MTRSLRKAFSFLLTFALIATSGLVGAGAAYGADTAPAESAPAALADPVADPALFNFENGQTHGFQVSNGTVEADSSKAYAGSGSLKVNFTGDGMAELGLDNPGGDIQPGTKILYRVFIPAGTNVDIQTYIFGKGYAWNGKWNAGGGEKDKWITLDVTFASGEAPTPKLGMQIFPQNGPGHIWVDSITYPGYGELPDTEPPSAPANVTAAAAETSVALQWTASTDNKGVKDYEVYRGSIRVGTTADTSFKVNRLQPNRPYSFTVRAYDAVGNASSSEVVAVATKAASAAVAAQYDELTNSAAVSGTVSSGKGHQVTLHVVDPAGQLSYFDQATLGDNGSYRFVYSLGKPVAGNYQVTVSANGIAAPASAVLAVSDTIAPTAPANVRVTGTDKKSISLAWDASSDTFGVTEYVIFQDGSQIGTVTGNTLVYKANNLKHKRSYTFTLKAKDKAGHVSESSSPVTAVADAPKDADEGDKQL